MNASTIWKAYRKARAIASIHLWDRKARRQELAFQARLERIVGEYDARSRALSELISLKSLKDARGKTEEYERRQPLAWAAARAAMGSR